MLTAEQHANMTALNDAAAEAWQDAPARCRSISFTWRGSSYSVRHDGFRLLVSTEDGTKIECRPA